MERSKDDDEGGREGEEEEEGGGLKCRQGGALVFPLL